MATIRYNNNGISRRDQLSNCIQQHRKGVFCAIQPEVISQGPAMATSSSVMGWLVVRHGISTVRNVADNLLCV
jgi:hypothetical protein